MRRGVSEARERIIRELFEHERDFHYREFRKHQWNVPEIVAAAPDPDMREKALRGFWNKDAEGRFEEYRSAVAGLRMAELLSEREQWIEKLNCVGLLEYREMVSQASRMGRAANDNERGIDR
jgi:hypothetical protein